MTKQLTTQPYKGTKDFFPEEYLVQEYIFSKWKEVCLKFGYKEYQTPLLEYADLYRAKSGEDVGGKELFTLTDLAGRELAIRPEMTPSVTRLVARIYKETPKPIRLFNISNFCRNERPQKGRNREFWQLNADIFGEESIAADIEILSLAMEIMLAFNPPKEAFKLYFNNRKLINTFLTEVIREDLDKERKTILTRLMDKYEKFNNEEEYIKALLDAGFEDETVTKLLLYLNSSSLTILENFPEIEASEGAKEVVYTQEAMTTLGYGEYVEFKPNIIRGFDYYDGMIFEVFDTNKQNPRSLFGGGRYNGLANIFGMENIPAVGFAPGNETFGIFLENWNLLPKSNKYSEILYFPLLEQVEYTQASKIANLLRSKGYMVQLSTKQTTLNAALREANKLNVKKVVILGTEEIATNKIILKDMDTGKQEILNF